MHNESFTLQRTTQAGEKENHEQSWLLRYALVHSKRLLLRTNPLTQTVTFFRSPGYREYTHSFSQLLDIIDEKDRDVEKCVEIR